MKQQQVEERIAITVWDQRISPVFDSARTLLIAEIKENALVGTSFRKFDLDHSLALLQILRAEKVTTIICGAVSEGPAGMLMAAGFELISFVAGDVHRVLEAFIKGEQLGENFKMPGCGKNICCRGKIRRGREIGTLRNNDRREEVKAEVATDNR
ncbi:MAG: NifB/NifX family molybdenum-iron cluster-binding protein [Proteobacteria bacterium]|nr:NifB/NifX family molybdenum-iron cluster-binding protein [Pseudomonadota bacterium]